MRKKTSIKTISTKKAFSKTVPAKTVSANTVSGTKKIAHSKKTDQLKLRALKKAKHIKPSAIDQTKKSIHQKMRLNQFIAQTTLLSRRKSEELIINKEIRINGKIITNLSTQVTPSQDKVFHKKVLLKLPRHNIYIMFYKPAQVLTSMSDGETKRAHVAQFFPQLKSRVFPVGRLDWSSEGLLLMTNDGEFSQKIIHPQFKVTKTYLIKIDKPISATHKAKLLNGIPSDIGRLKANHVHTVKQYSRNDKKTKYSWVQIQINEGKNRMLRRMLSKLGYRIQRLKRIAIGNLKLGKLPQGQFTYLTPQQVDKIFTPIKEVKKFNTDLTTKPVSKRRNLKNRPTREKRLGPIKESKKRTVTKSKVKIQKSRRNRK
ncbi:MAG: rRNA pseudouridine synthase [Bdellovibrionaceae bacterium]|nr:rRNA pseudouridine synthase [Pseudobdellovibrionaceae bacterium]